MITAQNARKTQQKEKSWENELQDLDIMIKIAMDEGKTSVKWDGFPICGDDFFQTPTETTTSFINKIESFGYKTRLWSDSRSGEVKLFLKIDWSN